MSRARSSADALAARLTRSSRVVAEEFRRRWPEATAQLGVDGAIAWAEQGAALLEGVGTGSAAAISYFRVLALSTAVPARQAWVAAALQIARVAPPLAASFCETTVSLVGHLAEIGRAHV